MTTLNRLNFVSVAGLVLVIGGIIGMARGGYLYLKADAGLQSLEAIYATQGRYMTYDDEGNFTDRGTAEGGAKILSLLENDWDFQLNKANLDPNDTLVNTPDELMVQYGIINYHTLHGTQTVVLDEAVEYQGVAYEAGTYEVAGEGKYYSDYDRKHPLEGPARTMAWSPLALSLNSALIGGVNSDLQAGMAHFLSWSIFAGFGLMFAVSGTFVIAGGVQLNRRQEKEEETIVQMAATIPDQSLPVPSGTAE